MPELLFHCFRWLRHCLLLFVERLLLYQSKQYAILNKYTRKTTKLSEEYKMRERQENIHTKLEIKLNALITIKPRVTIRVKNAEMEIVSKKSEIMSERTRNDDGRQFKYLALPSPCTESEFKKKN